MDAHCACLYSTNLMHLLTQCGRHMSVQTWQNVFVCVVFVYVSVYVRVCVHACDMCVCVYVHARDVYMCVCVCLVVLHRHFLWSIYY